MLFILFWVFASNVYPKPQEWQFSDMTDSMTDRCCDIRDTYFDFWFIFIINYTIKCQKVVGKKSIKNVREPKSDIFSWIVLFKHRSVTHRYWIYSDIKQQNKAANTCHLWKRFGIFAGWVPWIASGIYLHCCFSFKAPQRHLFLFTNILFLMT